MTLELDDIQSGVLRTRPSPYAGAYALIRIAWVSVAFTFEGLKALRLPAESLNSFPPEFQQGMAALADVLGDEGENSPANWEKPFCSPEVHVALAAMAPDEDRLESVLERARAHFSAPGIEVIYQRVILAADVVRQTLEQLPLREATMALVDAVTALRASELVALKWKNVGWETGILQSELALVEGELKETKSGKNGTILCLLRSPFYRYFVFGGKTQPIDPTRIGSLPVRIIMARLHTPIRFSSDDTFVP